MGNLNSKHNNLSVNSAEVSEISDPFVDKLQLIYRDFERRSLETFRRFNIPIVVDYQNIIEYCEKEIEKAVIQGNKSVLTLYIGHEEKCSKTGIYSIVPRDDLQCNSFKSLRNYYNCEDIPDFTFREGLDYSSRYNTDNSFQKIIYEFGKYWNKLHPNINCNSYVSATYLFLKFKLE